MRLFTSLTTLFVFTLQAFLTVSRSRSPPRTNNLPVPTVESAPITRISLGPALLASRLVKLFLQALVHVLDADLERGILDAQFLFSLGAAVHVGLGSNLFTLARLADRDVGDLVAGEAVDDVDCGWSGRAGWGRGVGQSRGLLRKT
jgi:hypothetical protein